MYKSEEQIQKEIQRLKAVKPRVRRHSYFGDDHHAAIDAQIEVLQNALEENEVTNVFAYSPENVRDEAFDAFYWMTGNDDARNDDPDKSPADGWEEFAK